jgi:pimeloyl-ACP methyl ester carboxylesterase
MTHRGETKPPEPGIVTDGDRIRCGSAVEGAGGGWLLSLPVTWLFPAAARLGWATTTVPNPPEGDARAAAYLLRGNGAVFSPGFGRLCDRLRAAGVWAEDLRCVGDRWACRHLVGHRAAGRLAGPVVLVGHSRGGRRALAAAARLGRAGVAVDLLVCVDVAFPPPVPGNVRRAVHLYRSGWRAYPARPLRPAPGACGRLENIDLDGPGSPVPGRGLHHLNITASPALQAWVAGQIEGLVGEAGLPLQDAAITRLPDRREWRG